MNCRRFWHRQGLVLALLMGLAAAPGASAQGSVHALLVGVSEYPELSESVQLAGPRNDVRLWRDFLARRGVASEQVHVLADGVDGGGLPTREAILDALEALSATAGQGDEVFLFFAGHGAQQPVSAEGAGDEPDGLDEIFLPRDAAGWNAPRQAVDNAIVDDELRTAIAAIRRSGASVWAVFDTCHSATATRAVRAEGVRYRQVPPAELGIPPEALEAAQAHAGVRTRGAGGGEPESPADLQGGDGGLVAFYAAQSTQETPEYRLPRGAAEAREHGVFSFTLHEVLAEAPGATYRQAIDAVIQRFQTMPRATAVPLAEGLDLDRGVLGADADAITQWQLVSDGRNLALKAGKLHRITAGAVLAVLPSATADDDARLGYVEVTDADLTSARVRPVAHNGMPAPAVLDLPLISFARPAVLPVDFTLAVAVLGDDSGAGRCAAPDAALQRAVATVRTGGSDLAERLDWPGEPGAADVWLCRIGQRLYLLGPQTPVDETDGAPLAPYLDLAAAGSTALADRLEDALGRVSRVRNLLRVARQSASAAAPALETALHVRPIGREGDGRACEWLYAPEPPPDSERHRAGRELELTAGDCVSLVITNRGRSPVDITVLFVDAQFGITALWPGPRQLYNGRIEADGRIAVGEFAAHADTVGREQLIVLGVKVEAASQPADLRFLAQAGVRTRSAAPSRPLEALLAEGGFGASRTRGMGAPGGGGAGLEAAVFPTRVRPDSE
ncbi:caspase family protein [Spiribacter halobius]|uniref:Peptidase C14 caspase domain-containing protein n=1 Tax=Sediminicurvatus halobius TaxID=2182432 RepID=A0A2U2N9D4_9GAMM|nr:caspase family protein [Spiribacter halobius]PWG65806.1 hypothetical protein DEM34_00645 [Spiribacter halobius]UEX77848.1 caspase family protein [Spiribacter halobius]